MKFTSLMSTSLFLGLSHSLRSRPLPQHEDAQNVNSNHSLVHRHSNNSSQGPAADDYDAAYDHLYDNHAYHADSDYTHETPMIQKVASYKAYWAKDPANPPCQRVVVLGCSHGKGAQLLHENGFQVWGIDVAQKAIATARELRSNTCGGTPEQCFVQGSLTQLPYAANNFDAGMSVDVLEHISPADVPAVVSEISRTVTHYLFLQIASFTEIGKNGEKAGMENLHLTTEGPAWWSAQFGQHGWKIAEDASDADYVNLVLWK